MHSTDYVADYPQINPVGRFVEEIQLNVQDATLPDIASVPALTSTHSATSNSSTCSIPHESHSDLISTSSDLLLKSKATSNPFLLPRTHANLKKSISLNGLEEPCGLFSYGSLKNEDDNVISISLADIDDAMLGLDSLALSEAEPKQAHGFSGLSSRSSTECGTDLPPLPVALPSPCTSSINLPSKSEGDSTKDVAGQLAGNQLLSSSLPVSSSKSNYSLHRKVKRKKFVLNPQHISNYIPPSDDDLVYTTELPEMFRDNLKSSLADSYSARIRRKVVDRPPPAMPAHLDSTFINTTATASKDDKSTLPIPNHVVLNHLATTSIKHDMLAVASTTRYREKFSEYPLFLFYRGEEVTNRSSYSNFLRTHLDPIWCLFIIITIILFFSPFFLVLFFFYAELNTDRQPADETIGFIAML